MIIKKIYENLGMNDGATRLIGIWDTVLERGSAVVPHIHEDVEEVYYLLEGSGEMRIDDEVESVRAGDIVYIPPRKVHTLTHTGDKTLRFITVSIDTSGVAKHPSLPPYIA